MSLTLLQIAGNQVWPNFIPILGYRPRHVTFFTSLDPKKTFAASIKHMHEAASRAGIPFQYNLISTPTKEPTLKECREALARLHQPIDLINLTGGTKAMSTAAHCFAQEHQIPSFHLDTRRPAQPFDDFASAAQTLPFPDLATISQQIDVRLALKAQGFPVPASFKTPSSNQLAFGRDAAQIRNDPADHQQIARELSQLRQRFFDEKGSFLRKGKLRNALQQAIIAEPNSPWHAYLSAASQHGITQALDPDGSFLLVTADPVTSNAEELNSQASANFKLLEGIWFELAVLARLQTKSSFSDVCWSVEADRNTDPNADSKGETDLVAFNRLKYNLHFISCKTSGPHSSPLDHIQGLRGRATKEGGKFSKAELWIFQPKSEKHRNDLNNHCNEQNVELRVFTDDSP